MSSPGTAGRAARGLRELGAVDRAVYAAVAATPTPALDEPLRRLSHAANNSGLWLAIAAGLGVAGGGDTGARTMALVVSGLVGTFIGMCIGIGYAARKRMDRWSPRYLCLFGRATLRSLSCPTAARRQSLKGTHLSVRGPRRTAAMMKRRRTLNEEGNTMADPVTEKLPLRHPAEIPMFILMVVLNVAILALLIDLLATTALIPPSLRGTNWEATIRAVAGAIILVAPAILVVRQIQRASIRGTAVQLSRTQFPDLYAAVDDFAATLGVKPTPTVFLSNGNGTLNGRHLGGFWVGISQLPRTHPWTVRRIWRLHQLGLFGPADTVDQAHRSQSVA